ncbi:MAG: ASPIC/UnbV domain protein [Acidobacteriaceae bacterium]|nr:ASPIC/UnbV domain protein [Acidobacteriaceae bacterium]
MQVHLRFVLCTVASMTLAVVALGQSIPGQPAQKPNEGGQPPAVGGVNTGGPHVAIHDDQHRPITAGGFVKTGPIVFEDIAEKAGFDKWQHQMGTPEKKYILETVGSGVGLIDYDNDGWLDIYLVNGSTYDAMAGKAPPPHAGLFHNNHDGTFTDVTAKAGVANDRWGFGIAVADYDNDGWSDLYITNFGKNRLYHNNHDGTFTDVAEKAGVALGNWSTGATWGDFDGDGKLDLFVPGYVHYDIAAPPSQGSKNVAFSFCQFRGVRVMCGPRGLPGEPDHLFHNNGDGTFTDVSKKTGTGDEKSTYYGLASVFIDVNNDGKVDLLVADDSTPNYLYLNKGDGTFEDASFASGYALNEGGRETASMGIATGDLTHNGLIDVFNTTFSDDYKPLYRNDGEGNFTDVSYQFKIAEPTIPFLGWGASFFDYDNDGWLDLLFVNGHVYPQVDQLDWGTSWKQRAILFHNTDGKLELVPAVEGTALAKVAVARGLAYGDLFNDGKVDAVVNNLDGTPSLFRNVSKQQNHWVALKLIGGPRSPRDGVGTVAYLTANGFRQRQDVLSGGSFASSSDQRLHFGLGPATKIDAVELHWPSGLIERVTLPGIDGIFTVQEGKGTPVTPEPRK